MFSVYQNEQDIKMKTTCCRTARSARPTSSCFAPGTTLGICSWTGISWVWRSRTTWSPRCTVSCCPPPSPRSSSSASARSSVLSPTSTARWAEVSTGGWMEAHHLLLLRSRYDFIYTGRRQHKNEEINVLYNNSVSWAYNALNSVRVNKVALPKFTT